MALLCTSAPGGVVLVHGHAIDNRDLKGYESLLSMVMPEMHSQTGLVLLPKCAVINCN